MDLPIRVTNSIPEDTRLAGSRVRSRCDLRNNPLIPFEERNAAIRAPASQPYLGDSFNGSNGGGGGGQTNNNGGGGSGNDVNNDSNDGANSGSGNVINNDNNNGATNGGNRGVLDPGAVGSGSLGPDPFQGGAAASVQVLSLSCVLSLVSCTVWLSW